MSDKKPEPTGGELANVSTAPSAFEKRRKAREAKEAARARKIELAEEKRDRGVRVRTVQLQDKSYTAIQRYATDMGVKSIDLFTYALYLLHKDLNIENPPELPPRLIAMFRDRNMDKGVE